MASRVKVPAGAGELLLSRADGSTATYKPTSGGYVEVDDRDAEAVQLWAASHIHQPLGDAEPPRSLKAAHETAAPAPWAGTSLDEQTSSPESAKSAKEK